MIQGCEKLVDALQRTGPGVLRLGELRSQLNRGAIGPKWSDAGVRQAAQDSGNRVRILDVSLDWGEHEAGPSLLDSWALVTQAEDAPEDDPVIRAVWDTLSALAIDVEPASRVSVSRWILKATEANALFTLLRGRGPPPTIPHLQLPP